MISLPNSIDQCQIYWGVGGAPPDTEVPASRTRETVPSGTTPPRTLPALREHTVCDPACLDGPNTWLPPPRRSQQLDRAHRAPPVHSGQATKGGESGDLAGHFQKASGNTSGWHGRRTRAKVWFWFSSYTDIL